jgi:hypothetical protein
LQLARYQFVILLHSSCIRFVEIGAHGGQDEVKVRLNIRARKITFAEIAESALA